MGLAQSRCDQELNWDHVAHIIRDVFNPKDSVISFSDDFDIINTLRKPEHSVESWGLYSSGTIVEHTYARYWRYALDDTHFGYDFCPLFISIDYTPIIYGPSEDGLHKIRKLMKDDGYVFLVNPGDWAEGIEYEFKVRDDLVKEIKSYYMFQEDKVLVLQK